MNILIGYQPGHAGPKIMRGFIKGFRDLGHHVVDMNCGLEEINYDLIMGYSGAGVLRIGETEYNLAHIFDAFLVQYWADDSDVGYVDRHGLILQSDRGCAQRWNQAGLENTYVPLATDAEVFRPVSLPKEYDIVMTGLVSAPRVDVLRALEGLNLAIYGPWHGGWEDYPEFHDRYRGCVQTEEELNQVYNQARICVDMSSPQNLDSANFTVFNAMASGTLLITNDKPSLELLFGDSKPPSYTDDCRAVVEEYLAKDDLDECSMAQRRVILEGHTYRTRAEQILGLLKECHRMHLPPEIRAGLDDIL